MYRFGLCGGVNQWLSFLSDTMDVELCPPSGKLDALLICPKAKPPMLEVVPTLITGEVTKITARQLITYGLKQKDTVTYSSIYQDRCVVALQREIVTIQGNRIERQEIPLPIFAEPEWLLAITAATIFICGYPPVENLLSHINTLNSL